MEGEGNRTAYRGVLGAVHRLEDALVVIILSGMIILAAFQITLRNVFDGGFVWADPLLRLMVLWVGLLGAMLASRTEKHIVIDLISRLLSDRANAWVRLVTSLFTGVVSGVVAYYSIRLVVDDFHSHVTVFSGVPAWPGEVIIPLAFAVICLRYLLIGLVQAKLIQRSI